jgi:hypothetical protein
MSLTLLKYSPFRASFTFGKRKNLAVLCVVSRGILEHSDQFRSKKLLHIQCPVQHKPWKDLPLLQISFQNLPGHFLTDSKMFSEYPSGYWLVLHHNGMNFLHIFIGPCGNWPAWMRFILQWLPAFLENAQIIRGPLHNSAITVHILQVLVHFYGSCPQFKVKFHHGMLLHVENFDTQNKHMLASTVIKRQLMTLQEQVCACWKEHTQVVISRHCFGDLFVGCSEKRQSHYLMGTLCTMSQKISLFCV